MEILLKNVLIMVLGLNVVSGAVLPTNYTRECYLKNPSIQRFREYLQIDTSKEENLEKGVEFWRRQATELGLLFAVHRPAGKPICVLTWLGTEPTLPAIMLNSHMDVVKTEEDLWKYPPFSAYLDDNLDIYARGAQDDKDVAIQYLEAIRELKNKNITMKRTFHITVMPDEETGGFNGMVEFVKTQEFKDLNVGFALDEGLVSPDDTLQATYVDKRAWQMKISVRGDSGHSSSMPENSAMEHLRNVIDKIDDYREQEKALQKTRTSGEYDSVNINYVHGGIMTNIIPQRMYLVVDVRLSTSKSVSDMQRMVDSWVEAGGNKTQIEYIRRVERSDATVVDDSNIYWVAMKEAAQEMNMVIKPVVCPAISDMVNIRNLGIPALGFASKLHTVNRIHGTDEYLNAEIFLKGIPIYVKVLNKLGNV